MTKIKNGVKVRKRVAMESDAGEARGVKAEGHPSACSDRAQTRLGIARVEVFAVGRRRAFTSRRDKAAPRSSTRIAGTTAVGRRQGTHGDLPLNRARSLAPWPPAVADEIDVQARWETTPQRVSPRCGANCKPPGVLLKPEQRHGEPDPLPQPHPARRARFSVVRARLGARAGHAINDHLTWWCSRDPRVGDTRAGSTRRQRCRQER